jgi:hypothetical protein
VFIPNFAEGSQNPKIADHGNVFQWVGLVGNLLILSLAVSILPRSGENDQSSSSGKSGQ